MIVNLIVCLALLVATAHSDVVRLTMRKKKDSEFVRNIVQQAKEGISSAHRLSDDGSVVIKDYQNSQYYGEIQL